jgi:AraC-like DNA-binding protein
VEEGGAYSLPAGTALLLHDAGRISTYKRLVAPMRLSIDRRADELSLTFEWLVEWPVPEVLALSELTFVVALVRTATRARVRPVRVTTPAPPRPSAPFREYFGVSVEQAGTSSIAFSAADAARPFLTVNDTMWQEFEPQLRARLVDLDNNTSVAACVRASLLELLPSGEASVSSVARMLAVSVRSLQRQLQIDGTTFQRVLAETRESLARHYLDHGGLSNDEVAFLLSYEDARSFIRAFVARTGATPGQVRRRSMAASNDGK